MPLGLWFQFCLLGSIERAGGGRIRLKRKRHQRELSIGFGEERRGEAVVTLTMMVDARGKLCGSLNEKDV